MKKKLNLTIDEEVHEELQDLPKGVSVSEIVSWTLKAMLQDVKKGRELTDKEFDEWIESTPEGKEYRRRMREQWGPEFQKIIALIQSMKNKAKKTVRKS